MIRRIAFAVAAAVVVTGAAQAQPNPNLDATFGSVALKGFFREDPYRVAANSGGPVDAALIGGNCVGYVSDAPTFELTFVPGTLPLVISAAAQTGADITLVVNDPMGNWSCNDDVQSTDPMLVFMQPLSGTYDIWVGNYTFGAEQPATLAISERATAWGTGIEMYGSRTGPMLSPPGEQLPDSLLRAIEIFGRATYDSITLESGFAPDPYELTVTPGGNRAAAERSDVLECVGNVTPQATLHVAYTAGTYPLIVTTASATDTTLLVLDPLGGWHCNDDTYGHDPFIKMDAPATGVYAIWVGTLGPVATDATSQLAITELVDLR